MQRPKKNSYNEFDNEKNFWGSKNPPPPPPHNFSNGPSLNRQDPCTSCLLEFTLHKIQLCVKTLGADIRSVTFPEFFTKVKQNPR